MNDPGHAQADVEEERDMLALMVQDASVTVERANANYDAAVASIVRAKYEARLEAFAEVSQAMNAIAGIWERDGSDPCRVRISREYANAYRAYAEGFGQPTGSAKTEDGT